MSGPSKPLVARLLEPFCRARGLHLHLDKGLGNAGIIEAPNGRRSGFIGTRFDLNPFGASELVQDKAYTADFLREAGLPVPGHTLILSSAYRDRLHHSRPDYLANTYQGSDTALAFAQTAGFPLFLKPNAASGGKDVERIDTREALRLCLARLSEHHDTLLLQEAVTGQDLRVLCLDNSILCVLARTPPQVTGDGLTPLSTLLELRAGEASDRAAMERHLASQALHLDHIPDRGEAITLLPLTNLGRGGHATFLDPDRVAIPLIEACLSAGRIFALRYYAVDLVAADPTDPDAPFSILEVNAAPGLAELHRQDPTSAAMVEEIYVEVFKAIADSLS